jgi:hypothetical protein
LIGDGYSPFPSEYTLHKSIGLLWLNGHRIPERWLRRILHIWWVSRREDFPVFGNWIHSSHKRRISPFQRSSGISDSSSSRRGALQYDDMRTGYNGCDSCSSYFLHTKKEHICLHHHRSTDCSILFSSVSLFSRIVRTLVCFHLCSFFVS